MLFVENTSRDVPQRPMKHVYIYEQLHLFTLMKRRCGVKQGLRNRWFHLQNEIKTRWGDSKNEIGFDVYEHVVVHYLGSTYDS